MSDRQSSPELSVLVHNIRPAISYYVCIRQCFARWSTANLKDLDFGSVRVSQPYDDPKLALVEIPCLQKGSLAFCTKTSEGTFATAECIKRKLKDDFLQSFVMVVHVENADSLFRLWKSFALTPP